MILYEPLFTSDPIFIFQSVFRIMTAEEFSSSKSLLQSIVGRHQGMERHIFPVGTLSQSHIPTRTAQIPEVAMHEVVHQRTQLVLYQTRYRKSVSAVPHYPHEQ